MLETYSSRLMGSVVVLVFFLFRCDRPENCKQTAAKYVHKSEINGGKFQITFAKSSERFSERFLQRFSSRHRVIISIGNVYKINKKSVKNTYNLVDGKPEKLHRVEIY